ncbi:hypothetical protein MKZ38_005580 [Zalerion maritima]|uniref:Uncharacterized protein n=1 Tax=Zalerion maritima TaxID=339359 RepID=A0AAD5RK94_9PEZI|nr:hypothetical protein MKZ38_005580 [Zalerion maritima]
METQQSNNNMKWCPVCRKDTIDTENLPDRNICNKCVESLCDDKELKAYWTPQYTKEDHKKNRDALKKIKGAAKAARAATTKKARKGTAGVGRGRKMAAGVRYALPGEIDRSIPMYPARDRPTPKARRPGRPARIVVTQPGMNEGVVQGCIAKMKKVVEENQPRQTAGGDGSHGSTGDTNMEGASAGRTTSASHAIRKYQSILPRLAREEDSASATAVSKVSAIVRQHSYAGADRPEPVPSQERAQDASLLANNNTDATSQENGASSGQSIENPSTIADIASLAHTRGAPRYRCGDAIITYSDIPEILANYPELPSDTNRNFISMCLACIAQRKYRTSEEKGDCSCDHCLGHPDIEKSVNTFSGLFHHLGKHHHHHHHAKDSRADQLNNSRRGIGAREVEGNKGYSGSAMSRAKALPNLGESAGRSDGARIVGTRSDSTERNSASAHQGSTFPTSRLPNNPGTVVPKLDSGKSIPTDAPDPGQMGNIPKGFRENNNGTAPGSVNISTKSIANSPTYSASHISNGGLDKVGTSITNNLSGMDVIMENILAGNASSNAAPIPNPPASPKNLEETGLAANGLGDVADVENLGTTIFQLEIDMEFWKNMPCPGCPMLWYDENGVRDPSLDVYCVHCLEAAERFSQETARNDIDGANGAKSSTLDDEKYPSFATQSEQNALATTSQNTTSFAHQDLRSAQPEPGHSPSIFNYSNTTMAADPTINVARTAFETASQTEQSAATRSVTNNANSLFNDQEPQGFYNEMEELAAFHCATGPNEASLQGAENMQMLDDAPVNYANDDFGNQFMFTAEEIDAMIAEVNAEDGQDLHPNLNGTSAETVELAQNGSNMLTINRPEPQPGLSHESEEQDPSQFEQNFLNDLHDDMGNIQDHPDLQRLVEMRQEMFGSEEGILDPADPN